jgi:hypothetical protein
VFIEGVGQIVKIIPFSTLCKNRWLIFSTSVGSPRESGRRCVVFITWLWSFGLVNIVIARIKEEVKAKSVVGKNYQVM